MKLWTLGRWSLIPLLALASACGSSGGKGGSKDDAEAAGPADPAPAAETETTSGDAVATDPAQTKAEGDADVTELRALAPGELKRKIYDAFGAGMTSVDDGRETYDFLDANGANFIGSISTDPNNKFASQFSIGYFLALAGLSSVVGDNYVMKLYNGQAAHDCREAPGAAAILEITAPTMTAEELSQLTMELVAACTEDPASSVKALVQSYSFALRI